jgi:hypothetical protein
MGPVANEVGTGVARRRRRRGQTSEQARPAPDTSAEAPAQPDGPADPAEPAEPTTPPRRDRRTPRDSERGWRDLAGNSPSQVGVGGALRARDVARPSAADLAAADRDVVIVRRKWQPPDGEGSPTATDPAANTSSHKP